MQEMQRNWFFVSAKGGQVDYVSAEDGELLMSLAVPPGRVLAAEYLDLCPEGAELQVSTGLVAVPPKGGVTIQRHEQMTESGANPDYQPTSADTLQRQMRFTLAKIAAESSRIDAKIAKLAEIERIPDAPAAPPAQTAEGAEVVES